MKIVHQTILVLLKCLLVIGCATLPRNPVPLEQIHKAEVVGAADVRAFGGIISENLQDDIVLSLKQEKPDDFVDPTSGEKHYIALAISGGGANGSFGAGFLYGWTAAGNRPTFKLVTGISTGALIAPFAFLGSEYDEPLKKVYTTVHTRNILDKYNLLSIITGKESFTSSSPLQSLIDNYIDMSLLRSIARAHVEGRRLYIGTTHMDAQRLVVWNMGKIAQIDSAEALKLFRKVLLASASIPTAMPPVFFDVEVEGKHYDEMHVDGATTTQFFFHSGTLDLPEAGRRGGLSLGNTPIARLYVIRNGKMQSEPRQIPRNLQEIASRALDTAVKTAAMNSLYRMYVFARKAQTELYYVAIPEDFVFESQEPFDIEEMNRLFNIGFAQATSANPWEQKLPGWGRETN